MDKFLEKVVRLLRANFPRCETELQLASGDVYGFLIWKGFDRLSWDESNELLENVLRKNLGEPELKRVGLISAYSPVAMQVRREERAREDDETLRAAAAITKERARRKRIESAQDRSALVRHPKPEAARVKRGKTNGKSPSRPSTAGNRSNGKAHRI